MPEPVPQATPADVKFTVRGGAHLFLTIALLTLNTGCADNHSDNPATHEGQMSAYRTLGSVERIHPMLDDIISPGTAPELLAEGFQWSEGPVWIAAGDFLLFSDVPANIMYRWAEGDTSASVFATPSGLTTSADWAGRGGSNGMTLTENGDLIIAQHGDRRVARLTSSPHEVASPSAVRFETVTDRVDGRRFNSPNDVVFGPNGDLYFTDPPYGLGGDDSPLKQLDHNGVYRLTSDGTVRLLDDSLTRPNGIAFSPDGRTMYVSNSDPEHAVWIAYDVATDGSVSNRRLFFDATDRVGSENPGLPDGMKVDARGFIYATGPGGLLVFSPEATLLGVVSTGTPIANCALGPKNTLYLTAERYLARIKLASGTAE